jgi:hypothetical protein
VEHEGVCDCAGRLVKQAGDARDGAVIRVDYTGGELAVGYENPS